MRRRAREGVGSYRGCWPRGCLPGQTFSARPEALQLLPCFRGRRMLGTRRLPMTRPAASGRRPAPFKFVAHRRPAGQCNGPPRLNAAAGVLAARRQPRCAVLAAVNGPGPRPQIGLGPGRGTVTRDWNRLSRWATGPSESCRRWPRC